MSEPPDNHAAELWRLSAEQWKQTFLTARRAGIYAAIPGLMCAVGVFAEGDAPLWLDAVAGATIATSLPVLLGAAESYRRDRLVDRRVDKILADQQGDVQRWEEGDGRG
jgi:hypothetical protein